MRRRWYAVGGIGVASGLFLGGLVDALTGSLAVAAVLGGAIAAILVVLAIGGARQSVVFATNEQRLADARARRARVEAAMRASRGRSGPGDAEGHR